LIGAAAGLTVAFLVAFMTGLGLYLYYQLGGLILPGVRVGDVALGGMSKTEAALALQAKWASEGGISITDGQRTWYAAPSEFGLSFDPEATAQRAYDVGHGQNFTDEMIILARTALGGEEVTPVVSLDPEAARAGLTAWVDTVALPPQDATLTITGDTVTPVPGQVGYALDVEATLAALQADPGAALAGGSLRLAMTPIAPRISDATPAVAQAERLIRSPLTIKAYDPITNEWFDWVVPPATIASWLTVAADDTGLIVVVDEERSAAYLTDQSATLGGGRFVDKAESARSISAALRDGTPPTVIVRHLPTVYTVQSGDTLTAISWQVGIPLWRIMEANPGLADTTLYPGQELTIPSRDEMLPLPVIPNKRIVLSISEQHLWAYQDGQLLYDFVISTGIDRSPTQPGVFQVQTHELNAYASAWDLWMPHFMGIYEAWPGFMNGLHGLPTLSSGYILWADILGSPASYGCIILDLPDAETLYGWAEQGVVVEITP
jgi:LysM repeat protein